MINIAIDGPSAAGKSTIATELAKALSYVHLDTGAMYRTIAYACVTHGVDVDDEDAVKKLLDTIHLEFKGTKIYLDGLEISDKIRSKEISMKASDVSKHSFVRSRLVQLQQSIAKHKGYILDGRDIGTVVLPDAEVKIYLVANVDARARRRYDEYITKGIQADYDEIYKDIVARDLQDSSRAISPLKKADDAIEVDSSNLNVKEVCNLIMEYIEKEVRNI